MCWRVAELTHTHISVDLGKSGTKVEHWRYWANAETNNFFSGKLLRQHRCRHNITKGKKKPNIISSLLSGHQLNKWIGLTLIWSEVESKPRLLNPEGIISCWVSNPGRFVRLVVKPRMQVTPTTYNTLLSGKQTTHWFTSNTGNDTYS